MDVAFHTNILYSAINGILIHTVNAMVDNIIEILGYHIGKRTPKICDIICSYNPNMF